MSHSENPYDPALPWFPCDSFGDEGYDNAPVRFTFDRRMPVTADRLFEIFEDPESWPVWALGIGEVRWTSPLPFGPGTTRTVVFWGGMQVYETFTGWERGRLMQFQFVGASQLVWSSFGERYEVKDEGDGTCSLRWTVVYAPAGVVVKIHPMLGPLPRLTLGSYMAALARYCKTHT